ncbi:MAG: tyrosine--tRNA ligase, partial [Desulfobulbia bacterium]
VWLDPDRTTPYDYYQYWINTDDRDVARFLALFTFLPMGDIQSVDLLEGVELNAAKTVLAFEATALAHGVEKATQAYHKSMTNFGMREVPAQIFPTSRIHSTPSSAGVGHGEKATEVDALQKADDSIAVAELREGVPAFKLFQRCGLASSGGAARRLIQQGGAYLNAKRIESFDQVVSDKDLDENQLLVLRSGKKRYFRLKAQIG